MYRIDLSEYKEDTLYFKYFDILLKNDYINKEQRLEELNIAPSSYRRARLYHTKSSKNYFNILSSYYKVKLLNIDDISSLEEYLNHIYLDVFYKVSDNFDNHITRIAEMIEENTIFTPVLKLFLLFLKANQYKNLKNIIENTKKEYRELLSFKEFFSINLKEICTIIELIIANNPKEVKLEVNYQSALIYYLFSSKFYLNNEPFNSLYCASKARELLINENNYKRIIDLNLIVIANYNLIRNYNEALKLSNEQIRVLKAFGYVKTEYSATKTHLYVSLLGLKKFEVLYKEMEIISITDAVIKYVTLFFIKNINFENEEKDILIKCPKALVYLDNIKSIASNKTNKANHMVLDNMNIRNGLKDIIRDLFIK